MLWQGQSSRCIAFVHRRLSRVETPRLRAIPTVLEIESLIFEGRLADAQALYDERAELLAEGHGIESDLGAIRGFFKAELGDLAGARRELEHVLRRDVRFNPIVRAVHLCLAEIAEREGRSAEARNHLECAMARGGELFIVHWARDTWVERFGVEGLPKRDAPRRPSLLRIGFDVLFLNLTRLRERRFHVHEVLGLVLLSVACSLGLKCADYERGATFDPSSAITIAAPIPLFVAAALLAWRRQDGSARVLRMIGGFYAAFPFLLALTAPAARVAEGHWPVANAVLAVVAVWSLAIAARLTFSLSRGRGRAAFATAAFAVTCLVPMFVVRDYRLFYPRFDAEEYADFVRRDAEGAFLQAERLHTAVGLLEPGRTGITDLYFVGAAGWSGQDVFAREVRSARKLFDERFDTRGRSIVLANEKAGDREAPAAVVPTIRRALTAVAARMDREEDVLFFFVTSHGSERGIALSPRRGSGFRDDVLTPSDLRSMLDAAGITWRVLVVSGCDTGVFVGSLAEDHTLLATAASSDRASYGCADGNAFTDFGRALFGEALVKERSLVTATADAVLLVDREEKAAARAASRPQIAEGRLIREKLRELEKRLGEGANDP